MQISVLLDGNLQGMGRTASCSFLAVRETAGEEIRYSGFRVISAPYDLPDGLYLLEFERHLTCVERRRKRWIVSEHPVRDLEADEEAPPAEKMPPKKLAS